MIKYTTHFINIVSFIIAIFIFIIIQILYSFCLNMSKSTILKIGFLENQNTISENILNQEKKLKSEQENQKTNQLNNVENKQGNEQQAKSGVKDFDWYLEIPKINLKAEIAEGTSKEVMNNFIGHFEETVKLDGNIGLAAHNRGYKNNYFARLKELKNGDSIIYYYKGEKREYIVDKHCIISDEDWSYLEKSEKNNITLITCVENEPNYRRCIRGIEKK